MSSVTQLHYHQYLKRKRYNARNDGIQIAPDDLGSHLFPFQRDLVSWALDKGRGALFADTGLGKTIQQLTWANEIVERTGANVLVLAPLAVSPQTVGEGVKFGIDVRQSRDGTIHRGITITNYERLHLFDISQVGAIVCDESGILKAFNGKRRAEITRAMRRVPFRLLCSATPAPNDYIELGTSSEALGYLGYMDMLNRFFVNDRNNSANNRMYGKAAEWRFKGHAEEPFWRWVTSWARAVRKPSDLGYDDGGFDLPELIQNQHIVSSDKKPEGMLFNVDAVTMDEQRAERRRTIYERCQRVAELTGHDQPAIAWCHLNDEGDMLERMIPDAVQVKGSETDDAKEEKLTAFARGEIRVLVTKPSIAGWGLNFQHCAHMTFFPSHSFEQFYQGVRRCWRYGQTRPVTVDVVTTPGERRVMENLQSKAEAADRMFARLVEHMNNSLAVSRDDNYDMDVEVPSWLSRNSN